MYTYINMADFDLRKETKENNVPSPDVILGLGTVFNNVLFEIRDNVNEDTITF